MFPDRALILQNNMKIVKSFKNALLGIISAVKSERHMRIHIVAAVYVLWFSSFYDLSKSDYAIILIVIASVIVSESFNTAVEEVVDLASPSYHEKAKKAKDIAAGAVLVSAVFAVIVGILFFGNAEKLYDIYIYFKSSLMKLIIFILSIVISIGFVFVLFKPKEINYLNNNEEKQ